MTPTNIDICQLGLDLVGGFLGLYHGKLPFGRIALFFQAFYANPSFVW